MATGDTDFDVTVFTDSCQGGRKYMEDTFCVAFQTEGSDCISVSSSISPADSSDTISSPDGVPPSDDSTSGSGPTTGTGRRRKYVFAGIFDGHGGKEAALFARDHLLQHIVSQKDFWSEDDDEAVLRAIREGFMSTHYAMLKQLEHWPKTSTGLPSTSGTTASICFLMNNKVYTGHVGDSRIILGRRNPETKMWIAHSLTEDHKPGSEAEKERIAKAGGEVMNKSGVDRVVWFRPKNGHRGPIRRSTNFDKIPFLAIARSLGDLWSYNPDLDTYVVSPDPDLNVRQLNPEEDKCLILASDGLWNMLLDYESIRMVQELREDIQTDLLKSLRHPRVKDSKNPSEVLVHYALQKWASSHLRADNTTAITLILNPTKVSVPSQPTSDENTLLVPTVLPVTSDPAEFLISAVDPQVRRIITPAVKSESDFALLSPSMQSLCKFTETHADGMTHPLPPAAGDSPTRRFTFSVPNLCLSAKDSPSPMISDTNHIYVNELPDESFEALSNSLRLNNGSQSVPKIISGVTVISDFDDDPTRNENSFNGKKNKCCSVTEALVDDVTTKRSFNEPDSRTNELYNPNRSIVDTTLQELDDNTPKHQTTGSAEGIENSSDRTNLQPTLQKSSSHQKLPSPTSSCSPVPRNRRRNKWCTERLSPKILRSARKLAAESRGLRFPRNVMARVSSTIAKSRVLRARKITFFKQQQHPK